MAMNITPNKETTSVEPAPVKEEPVIHDGSGGAFEGTELVTEERDDKPTPKSPTPY
ncbi:hypothetical protein FHW36_111108 [Chitinophaga polysaccharea]|uniref:Uncharacterized protein n=1 Tax=Chitinophaga polysaccharea TaxID=1293035 RepID=A0A561P733_9BACT|nr:hypothetical protein [Chitinophaga polysaccharea]TWF33917.1 hypothetical protein FHW36_111108 [Chitinophaga polysaccharea]